MTGGAGGDGTGSGAEGGDRGGAGEGEVAGRVGAREGDAPRGAARRRTPATIFFLSDYGLDDEFVGVVHAVLLRLAPGIALVDLTHGVPPFDVRAGSEALVRSVPHLGDGVVLAVVDPGVGTDRRGVAVEAADGRWFVGPDNGLLVPAVELCGGARRVFALRKPEGAPPTFDGRDVFAPAAAHLARAGGIGRLAYESPLGEESPPATLVRLAEQAPAGGDGGAGDGGRHRLGTGVSWVDRFGNVQLAAPASDGPAPGTPAVDVVVAGRVPVEGSLAGEFSARPVRAFADLDGDELGLLVDANGRLALVVRQGSAAARTRLQPGAALELVW